MIDGGRSKNDPGLIAEQLRELESAKATALRLIARGERALDELEKVSARADAQTIEIMGISINGIPVPGRGTIRLG